MTLAVLVASGLLASVVVGTAGADPIADKQAQASALQDKIDAGNQQLSALAQRYDGAQLRLQQAQAEVATAQARIDAAQRQVNATKALVRQRAATLYRESVTGSAITQFNTSDAAKLLTQQKYAAIASSRDDQLLNQLDDEEQQLAAQKAGAEQARNQADDERQQIEKAKTSLQAATAQQQQLLSQVKGDLAQLVSQQQQQRQAALLAAANQRFGGDGGNPGDYPGLPPVSSVAGAAINFALAQLGKPYLYAAAGPDEYDCSGLVMAAFDAAGVSLPHYSGAQYDLLPHIAFDAMQPGDLLFWGDGGSEHVAIYVGNGRILEAGGTGNEVHIGPIWGTPVGAARVI